MNQDDPVLQGVRAQISQMFGHHLGGSGSVSVDTATGEIIDSGFLSPSSPNSPPISIPASLMPLIDLPASVVGRNGNYQLSPHHLLSSPPPADAVRQKHNVSEDAVRDLSRTIYVSPSSTTSSSVSAHPPAPPADPTSRNLTFAPLTSAQPPGLQRLLPRDVEKIHIDRTGHVSLHMHDKPSSALSALSALSASSISSTSSTSVFPVAAFSSTSFPVPHSSHQSTAAPTSSDLLMSDLFSNKLIPSHTRSPTSAVVEDPPSALDQPTMTSVDTNLQEKLRHCSAFLGHRSEIERYASLITMQGIIAQHMRTLPPNAPLPPGFLQETTLRDFIVMLEQAPMGLDSSSGGRCHALCLNILKWYGTQAAPIVTRLASLLQRLWTLSSVGGLAVGNEGGAGARGAGARGAGGAFSLPNPAWSYVQPRWIVDTLVCIGLEGVDVLIGMCQDGYGDVDSTILGKFFSWSLCPRCSNCFVWQGHSWLF